MSWLAPIPVLVALPLFALVSAGLAILAHVIFRKFVPPERLLEQYDVAGYLVAVVGVLYSVVLGFLVGTVWTAFATAQQTTDLEAGYVSDAFGFATQLAQPERHEIERTLARYALQVRDSELRAGIAGGTERRSLVLLDRAITLTVQMPPPAHAGNGVLLENNTLRSALIGDLRNVGDTRRLRYVQSQSRLPAGMLEALVLGALMVIAFAFFFGVRGLFKQMAMTGLIAGSIGLFFGLILELSTPYTGAIQVSRDAWTLVITTNDFVKLAR